MPSTVYFTKEITPDSLIRLYRELRVEFPGDTAIKLSSGEPGGHNFLDPKLIRRLVHYVGGSIVECCTAYNGKRQTPQSHMQVMEDHGFTDVTRCDILDEYGDCIIDTGEKYLQIWYDIVGERLMDYTNTLVLSHFKGHAMAGFGGALKNIAIGYASARGKVHIHTGGNSTEFKDAFTTDKKIFLEAMADAALAICMHFGKRNMAFINVANNLSVDCDCDSHPADPCMKDIGVFASVDPVAVDQACIDAVYNSDDPGKKDMIERIESRQGLHLLEAAEELKIGSREYKLVEL